jgi:hypothetical protein
MNKKSLCIRLQDPKYTHQQFKPQILACCCWDHMITNNFGVLRQSGSSTIMSLAIEYCSYYELFARLGCVFVSGRIWPTRATLTVGSRPLLLQPFLESRKGDTNTGMSRRIAFCFLGEQKSGPDRGVVRPACVETLRRGRAWNPSFRAKTTLTIDFQAVGTDICGGRYKADKFT